MMNQGDIFKKIGIILNELQDQYEFLSQNPEQLNELELELFLANASFLSDHAQIVKKLNNSKVVKELPPPEPEVKEQEFKLDDAPSTFEFILNENPSTDKFEFEEKEVAEIFDRPLSKEEEFIIAQKLGIKDSHSLDTADVEEENEEEVGPEPFISLKADPEANKIEEEKPTPEVTELVEDKVVLQPKSEPFKDTNGPRPTLNDLLAGKNSKSINANEESNKPPITDLKKAITLNEKLLYIKDLFNGYNLAYSEAVDLINKMPDFKTADTFLKNNYAIKNNWEAKQSTVIQFYDLLKQRFPEG